MYTKGIRSYLIAKATIPDASYSDSLIDHSVAHCNYIRRFRGCFEACILLRFFLRLVRADWPAQR